MNQNQLISTLWWGKSLFRVATPASLNPRPLRVSHGSCNIISILNSRHPAFLFCLSEKRGSIIFGFSILRANLFSGISNAHQKHAGASACAAASLRRAILSSVIYVAVLSRTDCLYCSTHGFSKALTSEEAPASIQMCCQLTYLLPVCLFTRLSPASATLAISLKNYPISLQDCWFHQIIIFAGSWWQSRGSFLRFTFWRLTLTLKFIGLALLKQRPAPTGGEESFHIIIFILIPAPVANGLRRENVIVCFPHL